VIFFESRDCLRRNAPLSSFRITGNGDEKDSHSIKPVWERDLRLALSEAKRKVHFNIDMEVTIPSCRS
jgi:hypothetical protein